MKVKMMLVGAAAILAGFQLLSVGASAAQDTKQDGSATPAKQESRRGARRTADDQKMPPFAAIERPEDNDGARVARMLPLAGVTQAQAIATLQKLATRNNLPFSDKNAEEAVGELSGGNVNCNRLGLLCPLVGRERVPGIIRATWQAELRTADFNETMAAFDRAVSSAAKQNGKSGVLDKDGKRQIQWIFGWPKQWDVIR